ncbi:MAG: glycosyltransferase, partial [Bryobacteraceae bacterium]|nr:glycosyltransferase [Bryobacteraceae bacterium]
MRIAFFSPMPPSRSGIADYSSALVDKLSKRAEITVFDRESERFNVNDFDIPVYQIGNNGYHSFVYEEALRTPGVIVLHESNLHHLLAEITIKRNDWDGYLREVEYDGGAKALAYASRVRGLEAGPDYEGVPMLRRILEASKGVIVHSRYVERDVRQAGYEGSAAVIPHGAWMPEVDRMGRRHQLGVDALTPLIGIFGFLKPYKRIAESLRAFKRVLRVEPRAKMILVGEPHPDFPLQSIVSELGLGNNVRITGFTPIEDFVGYIAACDIVLNLRWPTVGESSGTLLRSLGLGRAVIVSDVGSFAEYPDEICLKVPVGPREEDTLFEYLNLLVSRPQFAEAMGVRAREWVKRECNWDSVADKYIDYLDAVAQGREFVQAAAAGNSGNSVAVTEAGDEQRDTEPEYIVSWAEDADAGKYIRTHMTRLMKTLELIPRGDADQRILEMGVYHQITPALKTKLGYGEVRGCYYGTAGQVVYKEIESSDGELFGCYVDLFDAERDRFPYADEHFNTVVCGELIEHLPV